MSVTIAFQGLCALVSEVRDVAASKTLDAVLVDAEAAGLECAHVQSLDLPAANLEDPDSLTAAGTDPARRTLPLAGRQLKFLPDGVPPKQTGYLAVDLDLIPEMKQACAIGTVDKDCFGSQPTKPVAARVELPGGGKLMGDRSQLTPRKWSFAPPVGTCYNGFFVKQVLFELPAAVSIVISVETLAGDPVGKVTLKGSDAQVIVSNLCGEDPDPMNTASDDTLVYYTLLDPPFVGVQPKAVENDTCTILPMASGGLGCVPFLLSRSLEGSEDKNVEQAGTCADTASRDEQP